MTNAVDFDFSGEIVTVTPAGWREPNMGPNYYRVTYLDAENGRFWLLRADLVERAQCRVKRGELRCGRPTKHDGKHAAWDGRSLHMWERK